MMDTQTEANKKNMKGDKNTESQRLKMDTQKISTLGWESKSMKGVDAKIPQMCFKNLSLI